MKIVYLIFAILQVCTKNLNNRGLDIITCGDSLCNITGGTCVNENECKCDEKWANFKGDDVLCDYKRIDRAVPLILEFFLPFGVGHFYSQRYVHGIIKFSLFMYLVISLKNNPQLSVSKHYVNQLMVLIYILVYTIDLLGFATGIYKDGNSISMY
jgi:hypothetical protein